MSRSLASTFRRAAGWRAQRLTLAIGFTAILALSAGMVAGAIPNSTTGVINGCFEKNTGLLRVIDTQAGKTCTRWETPISWSQAGSPGAAGAPGAQGEPGQAGADGKPGAAGLAGPQGEPGQAGADGHDGRAGADGTDGADGRDGNAILNGTSAPSAGTGSPGDFYLDTTTLMLFGPKTDAGWGAGVSLVGPQGPQGEPGPAGPAGPGGGTGGDPGGGAECTGTAPTYANTDAVCDSGTWSYVCSGTWADLNSDSSDGCEIDLYNDAEHCGPNGADLTSLPNVQSATCEGGMPLLVCDDGWEDVLVDGKPLGIYGQWFDGCESATRADGLTLHDAGTGVTYARAAPRGTPGDETTYTALMAQAAATATMNAAIASSPGLGWSVGHVAECGGLAVWLEAPSAPVPTWVLWVYSGPSAGFLFTSEFGYEVLPGAGCTSSHVAEWN